MTKPEYLEQRDQLDGELVGLRTDIEQTEKEVASIPAPADL